MKKLKILTFLIVFMSFTLMFFSPVVNAETYNVSSRDRNYIELDAKKGDIAKIDLDSAGPLNILFMRLFKYDSLSWYDDNSHLVEKEIDGAVSGTWEFKLPSNEKWIVVFENRGSFSCNYEVTITYDRRFARLNWIALISTICCFLILFMIIILGIMGLVWRLIRKGKK